MDTAAKTASFLSLTEQHKGIVYKVAHSYCKDAEDRKDLIQEIFIQLWRSFEKYDDAYKHSTWIYRIALNTAISFYRKANSRAKIAHPITDAIIENSGDTDVRESDPNMVILQQFIAELKEIDKALILLYLEEKNYKEIAAIMGFTETNVATRIRRIKQSLQKRFSTIKD